MHENMLLKFNKGVQTDDLIAVDGNGDGMQINACLNSCRSFLPLLKHYFSFLFFLFEQWMKFLTRIIYGATVFSTQIVFTCEFL